MGVLLKWLKKTALFHVALVTVGAVMVITVLSTSWIDVQIGTIKAWASPPLWVLCTGSFLLAEGLLGCVWTASKESAGAEGQGYDVLLARVGYAMALVGVLMFIVLFGLGSRGVLLEVLGVSEVAQGTVLPAGAARSSGTSPEREETNGDDADALPSGLEYLERQKDSIVDGDKSAPPKPRSRDRVIWGARMVLLPGFGILGSLFFVCGSLRRKRNAAKDRAAAIEFDEGRFWSGLWYRVGEGVLFSLVAFLSVSTGYLEIEGSWSPMLLLLGLLMAMFVKPAEQLVNGLALRLFEGVSALTNRTPRESDKEQVDPLTTIVSRLNDASETVRLQAICELGQQGKRRYADVIELLASFLRQRGRRSVDGEGPSADVQRAFVMLGTLEPPRGTPRARVSLRGSVLRGVEAPDTGVDLSGFDLTEVDLRGAHLQKTDFSDADVSLAAFEDALLEGARLAEAKNLGTATLANARYNRVTTTFPEDFNPEVKGMIEA